MKPGIPRPSGIFRGGRRRLRRRRRLPSNRARGLGEGLWASLPVLPPRSPPGCTAALLPARAFLPLVHNIASMGAARCRATALESHTPVFFFVSNVLSRFSTLSSVWLDSRIFMYAPSVSEMAASNSLRLAGGRKGAGGGAAVEARAAAVARDYAAPTTRRRPGTLQGGASHAGHAHETVRGSE